MRLAGHDERVITGDGDTGGAPRRQTARAGGLEGRSHNRSPEWSSRRGFDTPARVARS